MEASQHDDSRPRCCHGCNGHLLPEVDRRGFLGSAALGGLALGGLSWSVLSAAQPDLPQAPPRRPLVVKPVLIYATYTRRPHTSWRSWGGIQTQEDADGEVVRIKGELDKLAAEADFPIQFLPVTAVKTVKEIEAAPDLASADVLLAYPAGGNPAGLDKLGKNTIFFLRHQSGPLYLYYEIISPRFLRQHTDQQAVQGIDPGDVVVDHPEEVLWRLRALCGLKNTMGARILAIGGPGGWAQPKGVVADLVRNLWKLDIQTVSYDELGELIQAARQDRAEVALATQRAEQYLKIPGTTLETEKQPLYNAFLLEQIFRKLMARAECRMLTINLCMGTIMSVSETTACLPISTLNDAGYMIFCESDFVAIPAGMLLSNIAGRPFFMNDPTYPHDGLITLAHCTGARCMDGKNPEPVRLLTHFESDYGVSPKVQMRKGQVITNVVPDFSGKRWVGVRGEIVDSPFLPICRNQIDIRFTCDAQKLAERMPGFHWMTAYGDCMRETGYALKKIPIEWEALG